MIDHRSLVLGVALLAACTSAPPDRPLTAPATWQIDAAPVVSIGGDPSDTLAPIGNAVAAFALGDSQVVVADRGYNQLSYFDREGRLVHTSGREGDGPGEFRYIAYMWRCDDSLVVFDIGHTQFGVHTLDGTWIRGYMPVAPAGSRFGQPYKTTCGPDGSWISNGWENLPPGEYRRARDSVAYWLADRDGEVTADLGRHPGSERLAGPNGSGPHPLGKEPVLAVGRTRAYIGTADSFAIEVFGLDGTPQPPILKPSVELVTTEADRQRWWLRDTLGKNEGEVASRLRYWQTFEFPPTVPAYTAMLVDHDDNLWVRAFPRTAENVVRWVVFDDEGSEIGSVDLPATLEVFDIGTDWVLGIETRLDDGAQQVRMYRVIRG